MRAIGGQTFAAFAVPNYRHYIRGQAVSLIGTWMQSVAQSWLVLQLTGSATAVGLAVALQTLPVLLLGPYGGVVADRMDKRKLMLGLQAMMGVLALALGLLTVTHVVELWQVYTLAVLLGLNNAFENPARQTFILEMVGPGVLRNAVSLNAVLVNVARALGPAAAGLIITAGGTGICFLINAASFVAVVISLATLDTSALTPSERAVRSGGQLREGLRYVSRTPTLAGPLLMMALVGCLAFEFQVTLPVIAAHTFRGNADTYGFLSAAMGLGAIGGGLWVANRGNTGVAAMIRSSILFGIVMAIAAVAPYYWVELIAIAFVGAASIGFMSKGNSTLQLNASPAMRGRVMALWSVAFMGSTPIGGPIAGWVSQTWGGRAGLALGAGSCALATLGGLALLRRAKPDLSARSASSPTPAAAHPS
ncbi:MAG: MFS transporter [Actinobacteria bacterium]|nr:MFS transporter [Actinomycetota bacterium]